MDHKQIIHSNIPNHVFPKKQVKHVDTMKKQLGFDVRSEYFMKIVNKKYLNIALYGLVAKNKLTAGVKQIFNKLGKDYEEGIKDIFLIPNQNRISFHGPTELQKLSNTLSCNFKLIENCYQSFSFDDIKFYIDLFKKENKVGIKYFGKENGEVGDNVSSKPTQYLYLYEDNNNGVIISSYSASDKKEEEKMEEKLIKNQKVEETEEQALPEHLSPNSNKSKKNKKKEQSASPEKLSQKKSEKVKKKQKQQQKQSQIMENELEDDKTTKINIFYTSILIVLFVIFLVMAFQHEWVSLIASTLFPNTTESYFIHFMDKIDELINYLN